MYEEKDIGKIEAPKIVVEPPGPKSRQVIERYDKFVSSIYHKYVPMVVKNGNGAILTDFDGNNYIDLSGGMRADSVGYNHPRVVQAINRQVNELIHVQPNLGYHPIWAELFEKLQGILPGFLKEGKIVFLNSGSETIDAGMKLARFVSGKKKFIAFYGSFHGRTYGATSISTGHYAKGYSPMVPGVVFAHFPYCYRCHFGMEYPDCGLFCSDAFESSLEFINPDEVAAIILEPIQGVGGMLVPPPEYLPRMKKICDKNNIFMMTDEIETGFGVTGKMFAVEHWSVTPDLLTLAKAFGGGLPISALVGKKEIIDQWSPGAHGTTTGGCLASCAAAIEVIDIVKEQMDNVTKVGAHMMKRLKEMQQGNKLIGDIRGRGLFIGIELVKNIKEKKPATKEAKKVMMNAFKRGVIYSTCGPFGNVIRIMAPTCLTKELADKSLDVLEESFTK